MEVKSTISIAMTTFNGEMYIKEQLESILSQSYSCMEVVICDDMSSDNTVDIIKSYQKKDSRIKLYINKDNLGFKANFEKSILLCSGDFIALSDQDDIWEKDKLLILISNINNFYLIHSSVSLMDKNSNEISSIWKKQDNFEYSFLKLIYGNTITGCTILFKKELLKEFSPIPKGEKYHDWWLALLASRSNGIKYIDRQLVSYRQHNNQDTGARLEVLYDKIKRNIKNILFKKRSNRYKRAETQIIRLNSFLEERNKCFSDDEKEIIAEALEYYSDYINYYFHFKSFFISVRHNREMYPKDRFFIKTITRDLLG